MTKRKKEKGKKDNNNHTGYPGEECYAPFSMPNI